MGGDEVSDPSAGLTRTTLENALPMVKGDVDVLVSYAAGQSDPHEWPRDFVLSTLRAAGGIWLTKDPGMGLLCWFDQKWLWVATK